MIENTTRQVIESKLLTSLEDDGTVAILCNKRELQLIIDGLVLASDESFHTGDARRFMEYACDLRKLRDAAFD